MTERKFEIKVKSLGLSFISKILFISFGIAFLKMWKNALKLNKKTLHESFFCYVAERNFL